MGKRITKQKIDGKILHDRDGYLFDQYNKKLKIAELEEIKKTYITYKEKDVKIYKEFKVYNIKSKKKEILLEICKTSDEVNQIEFYQTKSKSKKDFNSTEDYNMYKRLMFNRAKFMKLINNKLFDIYKEYILKPMNELNIDNLVIQINNYKENYDKNYNEKQLYDLNSRSKEKLRLESMIGYQIKGNNYSKKLNKLICNYITGENFNQKIFKEKLYFVLKNFFDVDYRYFPLPIPEKKDSRNKLSSNEYLASEYKAINFENSSDVQIRFNEIRMLVEETLKNVYKIEQLIKKLRKCKIKSNKYGNNYNIPLEIVKEHYVREVDSTAEFTDDQKYILKHTHNYMKKRMGMARKVLLKNKNSKNQTIEFQNIVKIDQLNEKTLNSVLNKYVINFKKIAIEQFYIEKLLINEDKFDKNITKLGSIEKQIFKRDETLRIKLSSQISEVVELIIKNLINFNKNIDYLLKKYNEFDFTSEKRFKSFLQSLYILRNSVLHYSTFSENITSTMERKKIIDDINDYVNSLTRNKKINKVIFQKFKSNNVYMYYDNENIDKIMQEIDYSITKNICLPRFNKILNIIYDKLEFGEDDARNQAKKFILNQIYKTKFSKYIDNNEFKYEVQLNFNIEEGNKIVIIKQKNQCLSNLRENIQRYKAIYPKLDRLFEKKYVEFIANIFLKYIEEKKIINLSQLNKPRVGEMKKLELYNFVTTNMEKSQIYEDENISISILILGLSRIITKNNLSQLIQNLKKFNQFNLSLNAKYSEDVYNKGFFKFNINVNYNELEELIKQLEFELMCKDITLLKTISQKESINMNILDFYNIKEEEFKLEEEVKYNYENEKNIQMEQSVIQYENNNSIDGVIFTDALLQIQKTGKLEYYSLLHKNALQSAGNFTNFNETIIQKFELFKKNDENKIEIIQKKYEELENKIKEDINEHEFKQLSKEYIHVRMKIQEYNFYKNVLSLSILKKSNALNNQLNSRLHSWVYNLEKIERSITDKSNNDIKKFMVLNTFNEFKTLQKNCITGKLRNDIAHLNRIQKDKPEKSFIDLFNEFILINSYSTKRRNDVIRVFDKILNNFCLTRVITNKKEFILRIEDIQPKVVKKMVKIKNSGNEQAIEYQLISNCEVEYLKGILNFKK